MTPSTQIEAGPYTVRSFHRFSHFVMLGESEVDWFADEGLAKGLMNHLNTAFLAGKESTPSSSVIAAGEAMREHLEVLSEGWEADGAYEAAKYPASLVEAWDASKEALPNQQWVVDIEDHAEEFAEHISTIKLPSDPFGRLTIIKIAILGKLNTIRKRLSTPPSTSTTLPDGQ